MAQPLSQASESHLSPKEALSEFQSPAHQNFNTVIKEALFSRHRLVYHLYTIWLFTYTDLKTIVFPSSAFGILAALSSSMLGTIPLAPSLVLRRLPAVFFCTWLNLLPFCIGNQRQAGAAINLQLSIYPLILLASTFFGGTPQSLVLIALEYWYNDLEDSGRSCITRNLINASGFMVYSSGALAVALNGEVPSGQLYQWQLLVCAVVATTGHSQDMADQAGDRLRDRKTVPLVFGDSAARWSIAVIVSFWTLIAPQFWRLNLAGFLVPFIVGLILVVRTLFIRDVAGDKTSFQIWNLWMATLYLLPLIKASGLA